jgi:hypothetical protein
MSMRNLLACGFAGLLPFAAAAADGTLVFEFESLAAAPGRAVLDLGPQAAHRERGRLQPARVRERIALRLRGDAAAPATARVSVALAQDWPGVDVRVDGVPLSTLPRVVAPAHRVGVPVAHLIEISVPASMAPGAFVNDLQWFADTE